VNENALPNELLRRLTPAEAKLLRRVAAEVLEQLRRVYEIDSRAFDPLVGDNAQLFGFGIWTHAWFFIEQALAGIGGAAVTNREHSHQIRVGSLTIGVYKVGDSADESIDSIEIDGSDTKQSYPRLNAHQLKLFEDEGEGDDSERAFSLHQLVIAHFGNYRDGFAAAWIGAPTHDEEERFKWAWRQRLDQPPGGAPVAAPFEGSPSPTPFTDQPEPDLELEIRDDPGEIEADDQQP